MNPLPPDPYKALGVEKDAETSAIKAAYRKLVLKCHPDKVQDPALKATKQDEFQRVQQAYEILGDEKKRKEYDDECHLRKLREEVFRHPPPGSAGRPSPKNYYEYNVRTAEPPPNFRPGPPPGSSPYSPYNPQFSASYDRDIPHRSKPIYEEDRKARRTASYEKPKEESREERKRRERAEEARRDREKERDREQRRQERELQAAKEERRRERERTERAERERERERAERDARDARKAEKKRLERERAQKEKETDQRLRREQEDKFRSKKPAYVEHHDSSEEEHRVSKKKSSSSNKKHGDSPRRDKSARRDGSPRVEILPAAEKMLAEKQETNMMFAADYMNAARRKGSKSGPSPTFVEPAFSAQYPNPDDTWRGPETRSRRPSWDEKYHVRVEEEPEVVSVSPGHPPRLQKSYTSPPGTMPMSSSAPRVPHIARAQTMDYRSAPPPAAPPAPDRHGKSDRRRRPSVETYDEEPPSRPRRPAGPAHVVSYRIDEDSTPRVVETRYKTPEDVYQTTSRTSGFHKVKVAPKYNPETVYQSRRFGDEDISYSHVDYSKAYQQQQYATAYS